jgi:hypothetical protein
MEMEDKFDGVGPYQYILSVFILSRQNISSLAIILLFIIIPQIQNEMGIKLVQL